MPENRIAMTVKELFNSLSFDEIVNALQNTHRNDDSVSCLYGYKEAFDIISNIIMVVYSGKESPLTEEEDNRLYTAFETTFILRDIVPTLIKGTDENLRDEVALQIIAIKSRT